MGKTPSKKRSAFEQIILGEIECLKCQVDGLRELRKHFTKTEVRYSVLAVCNSQLAAAQESMEVLEFALEAYRRSRGGDR